MAASSLKDISLTSSSRLASASLAASNQPASKTRTARTVRWGAAVVEPARRGANRLSQHVNGQQSPGGRPTSGQRIGQRRLPRSVRRAPVSLDEACQVATATQAVAAPVQTSSFTQNRIRHALELFGACMMIVTFLALAMFA